MQVKRCSSENSPGRYSSFANNFRPGLSSSGLSCPQSATWIELLHQENSPVASSASTLPEKSLSSTETLASYDGNSRKRIRNQQGTAAEPRSIVMNESFRVCYSASRHKSTTKPSSSPYNALVFTPSIPKIFLWCHFFIGDPWPGGKYLSSTFWFTFDYFFVKSSCTIVANIMRKTRQKNYFTTALQALTPGSLIECSKLSSKKTINMLNYIPCPLKN